ncbi:uncharacterized protein MELLADRAFT_106077 [Melampsora larici-populina 98AG31]|uniref:Secreted protein n=1 Tax=Melampsora larici-populina (strain 98AG31 / pathotype 3-4-7) TaxID=747676 RepID=F4RKB1_MELLP|nr:uncharacterized protein MELLADRAFT_106077 [Melampsora larici-populina 98AG31]EGG07062.1 secreted protein [Melampsora larici-populina 98AG31]
MKFSSRSVIVAVASIGYVAASTVPIKLTRNGSIGDAICGSSVPQMSALLRLGDPKAQFIRPSLASITSTFRTCKVTVSTTDDSDISLSWGRLLRGPDRQSGYQWYLQQCGPTPGSILTAGGSQTSPSFVLTFASVTVQ